MPPSSFLTHTSHHLVRPPNLVCALAAAAFSRFGFFWFIAFCVDLAMTGLFRLLAALTLNVDAIR